MATGLLRRLIEILDSYKSARDVLRDLGIWGPVMTGLGAVGVFFWAAHLPLPVRAVLVFAVLVLGLVLLLVFRIWAQIRPVATPNDLARAHITHLTFQITDLARYEHVIRNKTFEDCTIYGPAILVPLSAAEMVSKCVFVGTAESMFWEIPDGRKLVQGAIGLDGCWFRRCRFVGIGFAGPAALGEHLKAQPQH
jgi:hypothetical protein